MNCTDFIISSLYPYSMFLRWPLSKHLRHFMLQFQGWMFMILLNVKTCLPFCDSSRDMIIFFFLNGNIKVYPKCKKLDKVRTKIFAVLGCYTALIGSDIPEKWRLHLHPGRSWKTCKVWTVCGACTEWSEFKIIKINCSTNWLMPKQGSKFNLSFLLHIVSDLVSASERVRSQSTSFEIWRIPWSQNLLSDIVQITVLYFLIEFLVTMDVSHPL